jgi:hypothetical protein
MDKFDLYATFVWRGGSDGGNGGKLPPLPV